MAFACVEGIFFSGRYNARPPWYIVCSNCHLLIASSKHAQVRRCYPDTRSPHPNILYLSPCLLKTMSAEMQPKLTCGSAAQLLLNLLAEEAWLDARLDILQ